VSDIPIGSPPAPPGRHAAPSGWYPDPVDPAQERYWDGWQWSRNTRLRDLGSRPGPVPQGRPPSYGQPGPAYQAGPYAGQPLRPGQAPTALTADGVPLAGWGRRALATCLDTAISYFVVSLLVTPFYAPLSQALAGYFTALMAAQRTGSAPPPMPVASDYLSIGDQILTAAIIFGFLLAYHVIFLRWKAATPGKLALGIRVVPLDQGRTRASLSWRTALVRSVLWLLPRVASYAPATVLLFLVLRFADIALPLRHPKRQSIHDVLAHTQVVKSR
jgi:uncharacterized RDD family membrane protein YckC